MVLSLISPFFLLLRWCHSFVGGLCWYLLRYGKTSINGPSFRPQCICQLVFFIVSIGGLKLTICLIFLLDSQPLLQVGRESCLKHSMPSGSLSQDSSSLWLPRYCLCSPTAPLNTGHLFPGICYWFHRSHSDLYACEVRNSLLILKWGPLARSLAFPSFKQRHLQWQEPLVHGALQFSCWLSSRYVEVDFTGIMVERLRSGLFWVF